MSEPLLPAGALITDRLVVVRHIGSGGLGAVYEVEHKFTRHHRAVKVLHPKLRSNRDVAERLLKEASAAGRIGNPHIVETFDAGYLDDGSPYLVMELIEGRPLSDVLRWNGRLDVGLATALMVQVATAVQAAHDASVVHRDLKPENLFLTERGGRGFVKVLDFGVSKFGGDADVSVTGSGITMGTPLYMAPEQLKGAKNADARSDVYSLGVILFEMLSGHVPFAANSFAELAVKVLQSEPPPLLVRSGEIPPALAEIVTKALHKEAAARFQTAAELGYALAPFAQNHGVAELLREHPHAEAPWTAGAGGDTHRAPASPVPRDTHTPASSSAQAPGALAASAPAPSAPAPNAPAPSVSRPAIISPAGDEDTYRRPLAASRSRLVPLLGGLAVLALLAVAAAWFLTRPAEIHSLAVLPFDNTTGDSENDSLADGLTESVIYQLSRTSGLKVIPRNSVVRAKALVATPQEAGAKLSVDAVLTGELAAKQLVRAELIDVRTGALLWGSRWERGGADLAAVQRELTDGALRTLHRKTEIAPQPSSGDAFNRYLKGRYYWNKRTAESLEQAGTLFHEALDLDPTFAPAWVGLADTEALMDQYAGKPSSENCPRAQAAVEKALQLDPQLATAHATRGLLLQHCEWKWPEAEAELRRAIALDKNYATAHQWLALHLGFRGELDRALDEAKLAQAVDPLSLIAVNSISAVHGFAGHWQQCLEQSEALIALDAKFPIPRIWKGRALRGLGRLDEARAEFQSALDLSQGRWVELIGELGATAAIAGDREGALAWRSKLDGNPGGALAQALISANLHEPDQAFAELDRAFTAHSWLLVQLKVEPLLAPLRDDPRFAERLGRVFPP